MIGIDKCREILKEDMTDSEIERFRDALYGMVESILDHYLEEFGRINTCKKQLSTAELAQQDKAQKEMALIVRNIDVESMRGKTDMK